ncbi:hypothetical protein [Bradyrhizobium sp.]|uniref:hypothetical protein n=1 Tax=Bradyrhizobium sp. TaxID=376 RepID=UPI001DF300CC|nr:hypothetical protein [Bradyrhizobium sp.]MBV8696471.1 hypothetical protein [Bradyrhizobium sp.]MBV8918108.1 hypothetical protein [Bradyrhizobium sp.]MBV9982446.1 hypothetical protein [Bradyrhizobium sp.]
MSIALDGFEVFRQLGKHADVFGPIRADVDKQARALVVKCLKTKSVGLDKVRGIRTALGEDQFGLLLDGLKDAEVKSVVTRLDKHHPDLKAGTTAWRREHLGALADGSSAPHAPPVKVKKAAAKKAKAEPARLQSEVVDIYREGGKKDR